MRGTGDGHYDWDLLPKSKMTNGSVEQAVTGVDEEPWWPVRSRVVRQYVPCPTGGRLGPRPVATRSAGTVAARGTITAAGTVSAFRDFGVLSDGKSSRGAMFGSLGC